MNKILDENLIVNLAKQKSAKTVMTVIHWWARRRVFYNLILIGLGLVLFIIKYNFQLGSQEYWREYFMGALFLMISANLFFTTGSCIEIAFRLLKNTYPSEKFSRFLFRLGLIFSIGITLIIGALSFIT